ncbi:aspartyl/asparaginyl beta-hydroxylase domain-containing protein [Sphingomonas sp. ID1715]|uniref:aspartyl/asparaginyl beta-hydroxylase domain-containing protein n=1 Tax=Sphingomonas sp. ID1715 TaxID=1656898 RepID=UPI0014887AFC|nr:aspartyl/asparaginyl beta-hydroxylase domain-containing protein [Sphingomonas sp. ID1715]NNM76291.1 aspartyl/asparaginyl beta-hydroxylase domain-containing protein [Sphingomonas sp. ID1715]
MLTQAEADQIVREGVAAMQRGAPSEARRLFEQVADAASGVAAPWLLIAQACRAERDEAGERAALDRLLAEQPRHLRGLVMKGDLLGRQGDTRAAHSFYMLSLKVAETVSDVPPGLRAELQRVAAELERGKGDYRAHLEDALARGGWTATRLSQRVRDAIALANGEKQLFLQEPTTFYFPGLPQIQFYERDAFDWVPSLEAQTGAIRAELDAVLARTHDFPPYVDDDENRPGKVHNLVRNRDWGAFHLLRGEPVEPNASLCPVTMAAQKAVPQPVIRGRSPMALFSLLKPGTHIFPHNGMLNTRLICHLPLIVPDGCRFRVGNEVRAWEEGKLLIFDDSIEHEAWNDGVSRRVVLLFEIWRPEIPEEERAALTTLFEAIDEFRGEPLDTSG